MPDQKIEFIQDKLLDGEGSKAAIEARAKQNHFQINSWLTGEHQYSVTVPDATAVVENTMYYPGWEVMVDGKNVQVYYQDVNFPGLLVFNVSAGEHQVTSHFTETPTRRLMDVISVATLVVVLAAVIWPRKIKYPYGK